MRLLARVETSRDVREAKPLWSKQMITEIEFYREGSSKAGADREPLSPLPKMLLSECSDEEIERAAKEAQEKYGPLTITPQTQFPSFTIYTDGQEDGGG